MDTKCAAASSPTTSRRASRSCCSRRDRTSIPCAYARVAPAVSSPSRSISTRWRRRSCGSVERNNDACNEADAGRGVGGARERIRRRSARSRGRDARGRGRDRAPAFGRGSAATAPRGARAGRHGERLRRHGAGASRRAPRVVRQGVAGAQRRRHESEHHRRAPRPRAAHGEHRRRHRATARSMSTTLRTESGGGGQGISVARLEVVAELATLINTTFDLDEIFRTAILKLPRVLSIRRASVALVTEDGTRYAIHTLYDRERGGFVTEPGSFPIATGLTGQAIVTGHPVHVDDFEGRPDLRGPAEGRVSVLAIPLRMGGRVIGALTLGAPEAEAFDDEDFQLARVIGRHIETALHYSHLLATISRQRDELADKNSEVKTEHRRLEALIEASDAAVAMVQADRVVFANHAFARLTSMAREDLVGSSMGAVHDVLVPMLKD